MSLTSELDKPNGEVKQFIDTNLVVSPGELKKLLPDSLRSRLNVVTIPPPEGVTRGALGTVGTAFDYRVRFFFEAQPLEPLVAHRGAALLAGSCDARLAGGVVKHLERWRWPIPGLPLQPRITADLVAEFFAELADVVARVDPVARQSSRTQDELLARYCLVLALFEEVFRAAGSPYFDSRLLHVPRGVTCERLLTLPSAEQVADVCALWSGFLDAGIPEGRPAVCNPCLAGSRDVGGADADLILGHCLVDLKVSVRPLNLAQCVRQLLGYVLLDYEDDYQIREVAVYAARGPCLAAFSLEELLLKHVGHQNDLVVTSTYDGDAATVEERLAELRPQFKALLRGRRRR